MVSRKDDHIDFGKLEDEVHAAVDAEERYYRENDAKFRAIHQKVATYDEFREIVMASHLKPLDKGDRLDNIKFVQPWNQAADQHKTTSTVQPSGGKTKLSKKPKNGHEFGRDWRQVCKTNTDKYAFLLWLGPETVAHIFTTEISFGLLGDILTALQQQYQPTHCHQVAAILDSLSQANRFKLSVDFLSGAEKDTCKKLFDQIEADLNLRNSGVENSETEKVEGENVTSTVFDSENLLTLRTMYGLET